MKKNKKFITKVVEQILDQLAEIYLYFLAVYLVCLIFSLFFVRWRLFFDWEALHFSAILFGVLSLMSEKGREFILSQKNLLKPLELGKTLIENLRKRLFKKLTLVDCLKAGIAISLLAYALYKEISPVDFLVLAFALASILLVIDSRIATVIALVFLASCPVLLILEKEPLAETMAIYAYYFLVICVVTQARECFRDKKNLSTD